MLGPDDVIYKNRYVWTRHKNALNNRKHHITFETASLVFDDPFYYEVYDEEHSIYEERFNVTGKITGLIYGMLVTVTVTYRGDLIRILSARAADPEIARRYYEVFRANFGREDED